MLNIDQITQDILAQINQASDKPKFQQHGHHHQRRRWRGYCHGLSEAKMGEIIMLPGNVAGVVFNLKEAQVDIVALGEITHLQTGDKVEATGQILAVKCSPQLIGRVTDALLHPIDNGAAIVDDADTQVMLVEKIAPGVIKRQDVRTPMQTGIKVIDALVPVGRGQRELIIGDRGTGKTALAVDAMINQHSHQSTPAKRREARHQHLRRHRPEGIEDCAGRG